MSHLSVLPRPRVRTWALTATAAGAILIGGAIAAFTQSDADPLIAKINGVEIHQSDLALAEEDIGQNLPQGSEDAKRDYLVSYLTDMILLAQAGEEKRLQDDPDFKRRAAFARNKVLMEAMLHNEGKKSITDQALHAVYDDAVKQMGSEEEVHARHILFRVANPADEKASKEAEDKVKAVIERLKKGEDFAKLANELTEDPAGRKGYGGQHGGRRPRLLNHGPDGAGVLRRRVQARQGQHLRSDQDPVRLARPQGRGPAQAPAARFRQGQAAARDLRRAQGADGARQQ